MWKWARVWAWVSIVGSGSNVNVQDDPDIMVVLLFLMFLLLLLSAEMGQINYVNLVFPSAFLRYGAWFVDVLVRWAW